MESWGNSSMSITWPHRASILLLVQIVIYVDLVDLRGCFHHVCLDVQTKFQNPGQRWVLGVELLDVARMSGDELKLKRYGVVVWVHLGTNMRMIFCYVRHVSLLVSIHGMLMCFLKINLVGLTFFVLWYNEVRYFAGYRLQSRMIGMIFIWCPQGGWCIYKKWYFHHSFRAVPNVSQVYSTISLYGTSASWSKGRWADVFWHCAMRCRKGEIRLICNDEEKVNVRIVLYAFSFAMGRPVQDYADIFLLCIILSIFDRG